VPVGGWELAEAAWRFSRHRPTTFYEVSYDFQDLQNFKGPTTAITSADLDRR
jgi:hypothetical protein